MTEQMLSATTAAKVEYGGHNPRIWLILSGGLWQAIILNADTKEILCRANMAESRGKALNELSVALNGRP